MVISREDFKELFNIDDNYSIPDTTLVKYTKYIEGSYLLHHHLTKKILKKGFDIHLNNEDIKIKPKVAEYASYGEFMSYLGNKIFFDLQYLDTSYKKAQLRPFWTTTRFNKDDLKKAKKKAFNRFTHIILDDLNEKFKNKYSVSFKIEDYSQTDSTAHHVNGSIRILEPKPTSSFKVFDSEGLVIKIHPSDIQQSITNVFNVFVGRMHDPVRKIVDYTIEKHKIK